MSLSADVYKRQLVNIVQRDCFHFDRTFSQLCIFNPFFQLYNRIIPVSYTHLDVYKRQAEGLARLMRLYGRSQEQAAQRVGKSQSAVANKLRLLRHSPQVLALLREMCIRDRVSPARSRLSQCGQM